MMLILQNNRLSLEGGKGFKRNAFFEQKMSDLVRERKYFGSNSTQGTGPATVLTETCQSTIVRHFLHRE